ncbi:hypothetical protein [Streptomyces sp. PTD5-9]
MSEPVFCAGTTDRGQGRVPLGHPPSWPVGSSLLYRSHSIRKIALH